MELGGLAIAYSEKQDDDEYNSYYFLPVSHPTEPQDEEDRPVKCPHLPHSSSTTTIMDINHKNSNEEEGTIGLRKKAGLLSPKADKTAYFDTLPRAVRKRHHGLTNGEDLIFTPPPTKPPVQSTVILQMFKNLNKFES